MSLPAVVTSRVRPGLPTATVRLLGMTVLLIALASLHIRRPATVCMLRATTGIPCPFCGENNMIRIPKEK